MYCLLESAVRAEIKKTKMAELRREQESGLERRFYEYLVSLGLYQIEYKDPGRFFDRIYLIETSFEDEIRITRLNWGPFGDNRVIYGEERWQLLNSLVDQIAFSTLNPTSQSSQ